MLSLRAHCAYLLLSGCVPVGPPSVHGCLNISWQLRGVISPNAAFLLSPWDKLCNFRWVYLYTLARLVVSPFLLPCYSYFVPLLLPTWKIEGLSKCQGGPEEGEVLGWRPRRMGREVCGVALAAQTDARPQLWELGLSLIFQCCHSFVHLFVCFEVKIFSKYLLWVRYC